MYDMFFISDGCASSENDFVAFKNIHPIVKKVSSMQEAQSACSTKMFWAVWPGVVVDYNFNFKFKPSKDKEGYAHVWPNNSEKNPPSVVLFPKNKRISVRELEYRFFVGMVKMDSVATYSKCYDVVFLSFNEPNSALNFKHLKNHPGIRYNNLLTVSNVPGIVKAHKTAASLVSTPMFWVVDADAVVEPDFDFSLQLSDEELDIVHVWRSKNPVNGLVYGHGGIKLLPTSLTLQLSDDAVDATTSISKRFKAMPQISNVEAFNSSPLLAWRTAFRECAKLASRVIEGQVDVETQERLDAWCFNTSSEEFAEYARGGASAGKWYGETYKADKEKLSKLNDYDWLAAEFEQHIKMFPPETFK